MDLFEPPWTVLTCMDLFGILWDILRPFGTFLGPFWDLLGPFGTFWDFLEPFKTFRDFLGPLIGDICGHFWTSLIPHLESDYVIYEWYLIPEQLVDGNQTVLLLPIFQQNLTEPDHGDRPTSRRQKIRLRRHLPILKCNLQR